MKKLIAILAVAALALTAAAQYIPSINGPYISENNTYHYVRQQGVSQGVPLTIAAASRVTVTNLIIGVGPQTDLSFWMKATATTNGTAKLLIDVSPNKTDFTTSQPLTVSFTLATNSLTQPTTYWAQLLATNFTSVGYIRVTYLTNTTAVAFVPSNIVVGWFGRSP